MNVDVSGFEFAISKIDDGLVFEEFGKNFLTAVFGYDFVPVGGTKDKGVDGFMFVYHRGGHTKHIFQLSTEQGHEAKIYGTIEKLRANRKDFDRLVYVTNRKINNADILINEVYDHSGVNLTIYDIRWFTNNSSANERTIRSFRHYVDTYLHSYTKPGTVITIANLDTDSRLYVFLAQQFDQHKEDLRLKEILADTLILYALEETDPDQLIFKSRAEVLESVAAFLKFDLKLLESTIDDRLRALSQKPRKINYHAAENAYCLPYATRTEIRERNLADQSLYAKFSEQTEESIGRYFKDVSVAVKDIKGLIDIIFRRIFAKQGLEFSNFVLTGDSQNVVEQELNQVINLAVDDSNVIVPNKEKVKTALHLAIRDIVYNGSSEQRRFLRSLSNTYLMMFLLQWEPKLSTYFETLASSLKVFVDNSIIIPALSEYFLEDGNRRHWNLLIGAKKAGISMFINETLLDELAHHMKMIKNKYDNDYYQMEKFYLTDEFELLLIDEILIRSYFYAKKREQVKTFEAFLDEFVDPSLKTVKEDLKNYLKDVFGIEFISNEKWDIKVDADENERLSNELAQIRNNMRKSGPIGASKKARNDAELILSIYYLRNKNGESSESGVFGYKSWWLSKDTSTFVAVRNCFGDKYPISCYIRPDFIQNYISLKPTTEEVKHAYDELFPSMLGVNLSYHMPRDVSNAVRNKINEFHRKPPVRIKQTIRTLTDRLKSDPSVRTKDFVESFFDSELRKLKDVSN